MADLVARPPAKGTPLYRHFGDGRAILFGPHALLLQVMHPVVGAGVVQHSQFRDQAWRRLYNTVMSTATWVYGGEEGIAMEVRRLRELHTQITGTLPDGRRYTSLAPAAWMWVYATLVKGTIDAQEYFGPRFSDEKKQEMYHQARELGLMLHVREQDLPPTWEQFVDYFAWMQATFLERTEAADQVLDFLRHVSRPKPLRWVVPNFLWRILIWPTSFLGMLVLTGTLPPVVREKLGLKWSRPRQAVLTGFRWVVRALFAITPPPLRYGPTVLIARFNTSLLREAERRAAETKRMKAAGQWDEQHPWGFAPPLELAKAPALDLRDKVYAAS